MDSFFLERLIKSWESHPDKPEETPESTLLALYFAAKGKPLSVQKASTEPVPELNQEERKRLAILVEQRLSGVPLAHLTKRQQFMGIEMLAGPDALIPRKETELLGYETLSIAKSLSNFGRSVKIIDMCTGSGNVILGVAAYEPRCIGFGSDLSPEAIDLARNNALFIGVDDRVEFKTGDLFEPFFSDDFFGKVDIISCNPPYISSQKVLTLPTEISSYEPRMAFDGGSYGFTILTRLIREAPKFLNQNSYICMEVGLGQGAFVTRMLKNSNRYQEIRAVNDNTSEVRVLVAMT